VQIGGSRFRMSALIDLTLRANFRVQDFAA
jgi:hypothetical protein